MRIAFLGTSHAAQHLSAAAQAKGFELVAPGEAELIFVSEDTPTDEAGRRDLGVIRELVAQAREYDVPIVLTSQVPPGFTRSFSEGCRIYHQAETLRMYDAEERALNPEMLIVGAEDMDEPLPGVYQTYLRAFDCPLLIMTWESAEFTKIAINCILASQVDCTNDLAAAAAKIGASWEAVKLALRHDSRIGPHAYLDPGDWKQSRHLLRDMRTLLEIESS